MSFSCRTAWWLLPKYPRRALLLERKTWWPTPKPPKCLLYILRVWKPTKTGTQLSHVPRKDGLTKIFWKSRVLIHNSNWGHVLNICCSGHSCRTAEFSQNTYVHQTLLLERRTGWPTPKPPKKSAIHGVAKPGKPSMPCVPHRAESAPPVKFKPIINISNRYFFTSHSDFYQHMGLLILSTIYGKNCLTGTGD